MTQPVDIEAMRQLLERATAGPWAYRPQEHDDWGFIRTTRATEDGWHPVVAIARDVSDHEDHDAHRASKTDPAEGNAGLIVAAVNALPSLLTELEALRAERGRMVEALEPFAKYRGSDEYLRSASDDGLCQAVSFTAGDYRRARTALQRKEPGA